MTSSMAVVTQSNIDSLQRKLYFLRWLKYSAELNSIGDVGDAKFGKKRL
jgi:hypothetical protein